MRCPACRADNEQKPMCRRCRTDLTLLWAVEERRQDCMNAARTCLRLRQTDGALVQLRQAKELRQGADVEQLEALAHLLDGNFSEALRHYQHTLVS